MEQAKTKELTYIRKITAQPAKNNKRLFTVELEGGVIVTDVTADTLLSYRKLQQAVLRATGLFYEDYQMLCRFPPRTREDWDAIVRRLLRGDSP